MELLRSIFDQLGINKTFFIQFVLVSISVIALSNLAFNKVLEILVLRDRKTRGAKKDSEEILFEYEDIKKEYDARWSVYQDKADDIRDRGYDDFKSKAEQVIRNSKEESSRYLELKRTEMEEVLDKERAKLEKESSELVGQIKEKIFEGVLKIQ